jgi:hypothetical protein
MSLQSLRLVSDRKKADIVTFQLPLDLKLVSVKLEAFALSFPTLNFGFYIILVSSCFCKTVRVDTYLEVLLLLTLFLVAGAHDVGLFAMKNSNSGCRLVIVGGYDRILICRWHFEI